MEVVFVEWPFLHVVAGSCFFSMARTMPLSQRSTIQWQACIWCCSPLHVVFYLKNWKRATKRIKLFCCDCLMELFFAQLLIFSSCLLKVLLVEQPALYVTTVCKVRFFSMKFERTTQILCFVVPCSCFCWTARFCSCLIECLLLTALWWFCYCMQAAFFQKN